jgi:DNA polymerase-3 subunit delta
MKISNSLVEQYLKKISKEKISGCLLYGPEESVSRYRFEYIASQIVSDLKDPFLVANLSSERIKNDEKIIADEFYSIPMLGGRKLITIKDGNEDTVSGLKILFSDPQYGRNSDNFILIMAGDLAKNSTLRKIIEDSQFLMAIPSYELSHANILDSVKEQLKEKQIQYDSSIINIIARNCGNDRQLLKNEINKISEYLGENRFLSEKIFEKIGTKIDEENLFEFAILFANKNYKKCLEMAENALSKGNECMLLTRNTMSYFQKLYHAKIAIESGKSIDEVVRVSQIFFKNEKDFRNNLQNLSIKFIAKILISLEKLEINLKKGDIPQHLVFLSFVRGFVVRKKG